MTAGLVIYWASYEILIHQFSNVMAKAKQYLILHTSHAPRHLAGFLCWGLSMEYKKAELPLKLYILQITMIQNIPSLPLKLKLFICAF